MDKIMYHEQKKIKVQIENNVSWVDQIKVWIEKIMYHGQKN